MGEAKEPTEAEQAGTTPRPRRSELTPKQRRERRRRQQVPTATSSGGRRRRRSAGRRAADRSAGRRAAGRPSPGRRSAGRAPAAVLHRRRRLRARVLILLGVLLLVAASGVAYFSGALDRAMELVAPEGPQAPEVAVVGVRQPSLLVVTHDDNDPSGQASGILVLAYDQETEQGTIVLVPTATVADVPGYGSFELREAFALGQVPLVDVSLANLLGVRFDARAGMTPTGWTRLFEHVGGFEVTVRSRLVASGSGAVGFEPGTQFLDGQRLAEYQGFRTESETELETLPRVQDVVAGLLEAIHERPELLEEMFAEDDPLLDTSDPELGRALFAQLATAHADARVTTVTLPVATLGSGREDSYRIDASRAEDLVTGRLAASRPSEGAGAGRGVQILNGKGVPAIGQQVAERLGDGGYRIVLTGNADTFDHETTLILIYDESPEQLAVARDVQERLGVGEIQRSATTQSVVDVTIVVGADFPPS